MYITLRISKIKIFQIYISIKIILRCLTFYFKNKNYSNLHFYQNYFTLPYIVFQLRIMSFTLR